MKPGMSSPRVRNVCSRMTSPMPAPPACNTVRTFSNACRVWLTMSVPGTRPSGVVPTCPATTTSSPPPATIPWEYIPRGAPNAFGVMTFGMMLSSAVSAEPHVVEVEGETVDAARRGRDPVRELARLHHRLHEADDVGAVGLRRQPLVATGDPLRLRDDAAI